MVLRISRPITILKTSAICKPRRAAVGPFERAATGVHNSERDDDYMYMPPFTASTWPVI